MNDIRHTTYQAPEWETRQTFVRIIDAVCKEQHITRIWLSDSWIARLQRDDSTCFIYGYTFPLNNAAASGIMRDKVATSLVLNSAGIPAIPHALLRLRAETGTQSAVNHALDLMPLPIVMKPNVGESGGYDVVRCTTKNEVTAALTDLSTRHRVLAVSPYTDISHEYRVVVLNGTPKLVFEKQRQPDAWHHNLKRGAQPVTLTDQNLRTKLEQFALAAMDALQARLAAVDIVDTPQGLQIMEINSGITLDRFSAYNEQNAAAAHRIYTDIIAASLNS